MSTSPTPTPVPLLALRPLGSLISGWKIVRAEERNGVQTYKVEDTTDPFAGIHDDLYCATCQRTTHHIAWRCSECRDERITLIGRTEYGRGCWKAITVRRPHWFETGPCATPEQAVETVLDLVRRGVAA